MNTFLQKMEALAHQHNSMTSPSMRPRPYEWDCQMRVVPEDQFLSEVEYRSQVWYHFELSFKARAWVDKGSDEAVEELRKNFIRMAGEEIFGPMRKTMLHLQRAIYEGNHRECKELASELWKAINL